MLTTAGFSRSAMSANDADRRRRRPTRCRAVRSATPRLRRRRAPAPASSCRRRSDRPGTPPWRPGTTVTARNRRVMRHIIRAHGLGSGAQAWQADAASRKAASSSIGTPSARAFSALLPASAPTITPVVFLLTEPATFPPSRSSAAVGLLARHRRQRAGDDVGLARQRASAPRRRRAPIRRHLHPDAGRAQAVEQLAVARLVEPARTDSASTGPISCVCCSCSTRAPRTARPSTRTRAPAPAPRARRRGGCPARRSGATARSLGCARSASTTFAAFFSPNRRWISRPSLRVDVLVRPASCSARQRVDVRVVAHEPARR